MSDNEKKPGPARRRPSYLTGPAGSARPVPASAQPETAPKAEKARKEQEAVKEDRELCTWKVWLLPRRPVISAAVVMALLTCVGLAYWALPQPIFVVIIGIILINRLAPYLFPVKYVLTEETAGYRTLLARDVREWRRIFTYYDCPDGVLLSNDTRTMRGRLREGLFLYYELGGTNREEVLNVVKAKLKPPKEAMAPKEGRDFKGGVGSAVRRLRKLRGKE
jgi:hypothetical protein